MTPEQRMKMGAVVAYVEEKTGVRRSRQTVYNWASRGIKVAGQEFKLKTETHAGQAFTCQEWVDEFITHLDQG